MTESELAFLAFGLVLGAAGGAALVMVLGNRSVRREIRVTVTRDAVPRRSPTLAIDAFVTRPAEPAPGGPGDRRIIERADGWGAGEGLYVPAGPGSGPGVPGPLPNRTIVPTLPGNAVVASAAGIGSAAAVAVRIETAVGTEPTTLADDPAELHAPAVTSPPATGPAFRRILRGDHRAMLEVVDGLAGADGRRRREWEVLLTGLGQAIAETAIDEGILEFPMGTPFWDAFTVEQCREIAASLASMGYRFDGRDGWADSRPPTYRDLGQALVDVGLDPVRIRVWPNSTEIAELLRGVRPAADDLVARDAPDLALDEVRELTRWHAESLSGLWVAWDSVRPLLLAEPARVPEAEAAE